MLDLSQIKEQYPGSLQPFERALVREYLQYKILQAMFESPYAKNLSFLGGTALRIIHGNNRFSEDIDLDNFGLSWESFSDLVQLVRRGLELEGFLADVNMVSKGAYHCYLRFPEILYKHGLSPHQGERILIQINTIEQDFSYAPENRVINKFDVFSQIRGTPANILLSQKIFAAINRKRPKGRDFYDITFLLSRTKPNMVYIGAKLGIYSPTELQKVVLNKIEGFDFHTLANDVAPFLVSKDDIKRVENFKVFWNHVILE